MDNLHPYGRVIVTRTHDHCATCFANAKTVANSGAHVGIFNLEAYNREIEDAGQSTGA